MHMSVLYFSITTFIPKKRKKGSKRKRQQECCTYRTKKNTPRNSRKRIKDKEREMVFSINIYIYKQNGKNNLPEKSKNERIEKVQKTTIQKYHKYKRYCQNYIYMI